MKQRLITIINSRIFVIVVFLTVLIGSITLLLTVGVKQGVDFDNAIVYEFRLDHEESKDRVAEVVGEVRNFSRIEKEGSSRYRVYFQNTSDEDIDQINQRITDELGVITEEAILVYTPGQQLVLTNNIITQTAAFIAVIFVVYLAVIFRKSGVTRLQLVEYILTEAIILAWVSLAILFTIIVINQFNIYFESWTITGVILSLGIAITIAVFATIRFRYDKVKASFDSLNDAWVSYVMKDWPTTILVATMFGIFVSLPFAAYGIPLVMVLVISLKSIIAMVFAQLLLKPLVYSLIEKILLRASFLSQSKALLKKW